MGLSPYIVHAQIASNLKKSMSAARRTFSTRLDLSWPFTQSTQFWSIDAFRCHVNVTRKEHTRAPGRRGERKNADVARIRLRLRNYFIVSGLAPFRLADFWWFNNIIIDVHVLWTIHSVAWGAYKSIDSRCIRRNWFTSIYLDDFPSNWPFHAGIARLLRRNDIRREMGNRKCWHASAQGIAA